MKSLNKEKKMYKEKYREAYSKVKEIINKYDLMSLLSAGAPDNEYESEISKILPILKNNDSIEIIHKEICNIFSKSFSENFDGKSEVDAMISEILISVKKQYFN